MIEDKFFEITETVDGYFNAIEPDDKAEWRVNPCTTWLLKTLEGDMMRMYFTWINSGFEGEDSPLTDDQAKGKGQALDDIHSAITEMLKPDEHPQY